MPSGRAETPITREELFLSYESYARQVMFHARPDPKRLG